MQPNALTKGYMALVGVVLVVVGLLGFVANPIVGDPAANPIFITGANHNAVHIVTGLIALFVAFELTDARQAAGTIAFGVFYLIVFAALVVSPDLFGLLYPVSLADHALHFGVGIVSVGVGLIGRASTTAMAH